ncbi:MAG: hydrogenase maturation nickel metallochaperone HypA [Deltaproteobacteria bacterium RBG_19FT_COMBO_46_9]|nr:MAG: hydrogenase maturation nickel metallochaperone HypA [Deltaproteobacteria bacterium RBG_19FT_COMBO_46_9]
MHEMSIARNMIDIIENEMRRHNAKALRAVHVNVGRFSSIVPEALSFCFEIMTKDTDIDGARLVIDIIPLMGRCVSCNKEFEITDYSFLCPFCGGIKVDTISGQELSVVGIEVD